MSASPKALPTMAFFARAVPVHPGELSPQAGYAGRVAELCGVGHQLVDYVRVQVKSGRGAYLEPQLSRPCGWKTFVQALKEPIHPLDPSLAH